MTQKKSKKSSAPQPPTNPRPKKLFLSLAGGVRVLWVSSTPSGERDICFNLTYLMGCGLIESYVQWGINLKDVFYQGKKGWLLIAWYGFNLQTGLIIMTIIWFEYKHFIIWYK